MLYPRIKRILSFVSLLTLLYVPTAYVVYLVLITDYTPIQEFEELRVLVLILISPILFKYALQFLIAPFYSTFEWLRRKKRPENYYPSISVTVPAWNEEVGVVRTIKSLLTTAYPHLEIIVINDGSTDRTHEVVTHFIDEYNKHHLAPRTPIHYRRIPNGGKARAMNTALEIASHELFITIDADSVVHKHTLENMAKHFADPHVASVAGNVVIGNRTRSIGIIQQLEYLYGFYFKRADSLFNAVYIVGGAAAAYRRSVILAAGGFDESIITEDIELSTRLQRLGHQVRYAADAIVYTEGPSDLAGLCRQRLRWKHGRFLTFIKHRELFFSLRTHHRFYLTFIVLPIALFSEFLLFFEWILVGAFYWYTFYTSDFVPLLTVIIFLACVVVFQIFSDPLMRHHRNLLLLAPGAWLIFYYMDAVEYQALMRSLHRFMTGRELTWQRWQRVGVFDETKG